MTYFIRHSSFKISAFFIAIVITISCTSSSESEENSPDINFQGDFLNAHEINQMLGNGINLGNALEAPSEGEWGMVIEEKYFDLIKMAGFQSVRIPIRWNAHASVSYPYTIDHSFLRRVDEVIGWALDRDLSVMINIHHYNELMENPQDHKERLIAIWKQLSAHYKNHPQTIVFEILNEPHSNLTATLWNKYLNDVIRIIRQSNPRRVLAAGTAPWGGFGGLDDLKLPQNDTQLITTVHYYHPFKFTHQGAEWVENAEGWLGTTWTATEEQIKEIDIGFDRVAEWSDHHNRPIHLGEFGAYSHAPEESRVLWTKYVRKAAESRSFSWAYWEFGAGFGVYDRTQNQWRTELLQALIPAQD